jgi:hypothetical protein
MHRIPGHDKFMSSAYDLDCHSWRYRYESGIIEHQCGAGILQIYGEIEDVHVKSIDTY